MQEFALNACACLATLPGVSRPRSGNQRTIILNVNPQKLQGMAARPDVVQALTAGNASSAGNADIGRRHAGATDSTVVDYQDLLNIPLKLGAGSVYMRDVARSRTAPTSSLATRCATATHALLPVPSDPTHDHHGRDEVKESLGRFQAPPRRRPGEIRARSVAVRAGGAELRAARGADRRA